MAVKSKTQQQTKARLAISDVIVRGVRRGPTDAVILFSSADRRKVSGRGVGARVGPG